MRARWMALLAMAGVAAAAQTAAAEVRYGPAVDVPVGFDWTSMAPVGPGVADPFDGDPGVPAQWIALLTPGLAPPSVTVVALAGDRLIGPPRRGTLPAADAHALTTGDLDGDGRNEVLVASSNPNRISVFKVPDGPGQLDDAVTVATGPSPGRAVVAELTGDTHPDVAVITDDGLEVLPGDGAGGLGPSQLAVPAASLLGDDPAGGAVTRLLAAGDLTGDGRAEVIVAVNRPIILSASRTSLRVLAGGTFAPIGEQVDTIGALKDLQLADFDGDGHLDPMLVGLSIGQIRLGMADYRPFGGIAFGDGLGGFGGGV